MKVNVACPACGEPVECEIALTVGGDIKNAPANNKGGIYVNVDAKIMSGPDEHFNDRHTA